MESRFALSPLIVRRGGNTGTYALYSSREFKDNIAPVRMTEMAGRLNRKEIRQKQKLKSHSSILSLLASQLKLESSRTLNMSKSQSTVEPSPVLKLSTPQLTVDP